MTGPGPSVTNEELDRLASEALLESEEDDALGEKIVAKYGEVVAANEALETALQDSRLRELPDDLRTSIAEKLSTVKSKSDSFQSTLQKLVDPPAEPTDEPVGGRRSRKKS